MDTVERSVELDLTAGEAWRLVGTADGWREWLADDVAITVAAGESGSVVDDGVGRAVRIEEVVDGRSVTFVWSTEDGDVSRVHLHLEERADGRRVLHVTERPLEACAACPQRAADRWSVRTCLLCIAAATASRV